LAAATSSLSDISEQEGKTKITSVNKNSFSIEIKIESHTAREVTALPPSFLIGNKNWFLAHFYYRH
jgi:hypothetical protein